LYEEMEKFRTANYLLEHTRLVMSEAIGKRDAVTVREQGNGIGYNVDVGS
jgi:hypothetical protein